MNLKIDHDTDFAAWLEEQISLMRQRKFEQLDMDNLLEEMKDLGHSDKSVIRSMWKQTLHHMLKWTYQPNNRSKSWKKSILAHSKKARECYNDNPGFKQFLDKLFSEAYEEARFKAADETSIDIDIFPEICEWTYEQLLDEKFIEEFLGE